MPHRRVRRPGPRAVLVVEGECARPTAFSAHDLASVHPYYQVADLSKVDARLVGTAVRLRHLIDAVGPDLDTDELEVHAEDGSFCAALPLHEASRTALLVYAKDGKPLGREDGGPIRFLIPFSSDRGASVKGAARLVVRAARRSTRSPVGDEKSALPSRQG